MMEKDTENAVIEQENRIKSDEQTREEQKALNIWKIAAHSWNKTECCVN